MPNDGYLSGLPDGRVVEVPATVRAGVVRGVAVDPLPEQTIEICRQVSAVHEFVAEGAAMANHDALLRAIEVDPAITNKTAATRVLDKLLAAHRDLLLRPGEVVA